METEWTCQVAASSLIAVSRILYTNGLTAYRLGEDQLASSLTRCIHCDSGKVKACTGWRLSLRRPHAIQLVPILYKQGTFLISIEGQFSAQRSAPGDTISKPLASGTASIFIEERGRRVARSHADLAQQNQHGTVWHLQLGGLSGADQQRPPHEWVDVPRWPSQPFDWVLATEVALFNFAFEKWCELKTTPAWKEVVKKSEDLVLNSYHERFNEYWTTRGSHDSWLAAQCNRTSDWNPRPA